MTYFLPEDKLNYVSYYVKEMHSIIFNQVIVNNLLDFLLRLVSKSGSARPGRAEVTLFGFNGADTGMDCIR